MLRTPAKTTRPYRYAAPSKYKRPRTTRKRKNYLGGIPTRINVGRQAFPKQLQNTLRCNETIQYTLTTGLATYIFSCNGLFDPNVTGAGHQPLYFDQLSAIYDHYTVIRSRIKVTFGTAATLIVPQLYSLYIDDDTSVVANAVIGSERPGAVSKFLNPLTDSPATLYLSWDGKSTFGSDMMSDKDMQGTSSTNPSEQSYFVIQQYDSAGITVTPLMFVELEYDVIWDEFVTVATS